MAELEEVCELFDVVVLQNYWLGTDACPEAGHPLFALGKMSGGLKGFVMTPLFRCIGKA